MLRHLFNFIFLISPPTRFFSLRRALLRFSGSVIGAKTKVCGQCRIYGPGELYIGDRTWIGPSSVFYTNFDANIHIGADCDVAPEVMFMTGSHEIGFPNRRAGAGYAKSIHVGDGCWIGTRVTLIGGVRIGRGSVIAAGAVVTEDVPENSLVGGVPARLIRQLGSAD